jgi:hypothetical protein
VNDLLRHPDYQLSIGLILCKTRDRVAAEYALRDVTKPIGVSEYQLAAAHLGEPVADAFFRTLCRPTRSPYWTGVTLIFHLVTLRGVSFSPPQEPEEGYPAEGSCGADLFATGSDV